MKTKQSQFKTAKVRLHSPILKLRYRSMNDLLSQVKLMLTYNACPDARIVMTVEDGVYDVYFQPNVPRKEDIFLISLKEHNVLIIEGKEALL